MKIPSRNVMRLKVVKTWYCIPWWAVLDAVDISTTMLIRDVDWEACQWRPVPWDAVAGTLMHHLQSSCQRQITDRAYCRTSITKFLTDRKLEQSQRQVVSVQDEDIQIVLVNIKLCTISSWNIRIGIFMWLNWSHVNPMPSVNESVD